MNAVMHVGMSIVTYVYATMCLCGYVCMYIQNIYTYYIYIYILIYIYIYTHVNVNMNTLQGTVICTLNPNP